MVANVDSYYHFDVLSYAFRRTIKNPKTVVKARISG